MKKTLLSILSVALFSIVGNAQSQNTIISFEENEGYTLGNLLGQNDWSAYGYIIDDYAKVINHSASVGIQAVEVESNEDFQGNWGGLIYNLPQSNQFIVSADVKLSGDYGSDYDLLSLYSFMNGEYEYISGFYFVYDGETSFGSEVNATSPFYWEADTWYNLKSDINFTTREIKLYVNNSLVNTLQIPAGINSIDETNFEFDNYGTGFILDNLQVSNLSNLGVADYSSSNFTVFPNPTTDFINVNTSEKIQTVEILDFTGQSIATHKGLKQIDVQHLNKGIYLLKVTTDKRSTIEKFIKN